VRGRLPVLVADGLMSSGEDVVVSGCGATVFVTVRSVWVIVLLYAVSLKARR
jgi:hypothetical protein